MNNLISNLLLMTLVLFLPVAKAKTTIFTFNSPLNSLEYKENAIKTKEYEYELTSVKGGCDQSMENISAERDVIQKCTIYIKNIQMNSIQKLNSIKNKSNEIANEIEYLKIISRKNNNYTIKKIASLRTELKDIQEKYFIQKIEAIKLEQKSSYLEYQQKANKEDIFSIKENNQKIKEQIVEIDSSISSNRFTISLLQDKVNIIESDVAVLMNEYANGNLTEVSFYGANIGAEKVGNINYSTIGLEYERLITLNGKKISLLGEFKKYTGKKKYSYETLNGLKNIEYSEQSNFYAVGLGSRWFFNHHKNFQNYIGGTAGVLFEDEKSYYFKLLTGIELYQKFSKLSFDLSYSYYSKIKHQEIHFTPTGASETFLQENSENGLGIVLKFSTR